MSLSNVPVSERCHISFFGCTNVGKSSLINAITNQEVSIVSSIKGTTTDPVKKTMELLPIGPVVIIDTAGLDDETELGALRIKKTNEILEKTNVAILVVDATIGLSKFDKDLISEFDKKRIPYIIAYNKSDLVENQRECAKNEIYVSSKSNYNINELKEKIGQFAKNNEVPKFIITDKLEKQDVVILVIPVDESAPKGRLILPQQNTLRELLDNHCTVVCCQDTELKDVLSKITPKLVITDSQVFGKVKQIVPNDILLTSFSILFARYKGNLVELVKGAKKLSELKDGDKILISEACTHHRQCNDIGTVKFPKWLKEFTKSDLEFEFSSGDK